MQLIAMTDQYFAWLLGEGSAPADAPIIAPGGLAAPEILTLLRETAATVGEDAAWMMVVDGEAVGTLIVKARDAAGRWDIGYGVAASREGRGHATAAVAQFKQIARVRGARGLTAETLPDSGASPSVLRRNGFFCTGQFDHPEDGVVDQWMVEW